MFLKESGINKKFIFFDAQTNTKISGIHKIEDQIGSKVLYQWIKEILTWISR